MKLNVLVELSMNENIYILNYVNITFYRNDLFSHLFLCVCQVVVD